MAKDIKKEVVEAAIRWRKYWVDIFAEKQAQTNCKCAQCELIRSVDRFLQDKAGG